MKNIFLLRQNILLQFYIHMAKSKKINILVIGSGGREHAICMKLKDSKRVAKIFCAPGNPGIGEDAINVPIAATSIQSLCDFALAHEIDMTFVGPEAPLLLGIVDLFVKHNLAIVGPTKKAAQIEGSKIFAKKIMKKYSIPTAQFEIFRDSKEALKYLNNCSYPVVLKADGPALGKGVAVCRTMNEAKAFIKKLMNDKIFGQAGSRIIAEEYLEGQEVSFMVATDGEDFVTFLPSQDHKRVFDNDLGPNTGGMGAYAPVPFVRKEMIRRIEREIVKPTMYALKKENAEFQGILYPGIILTKTGPKVLEFNCRFGDPETQPLLSLLKSDLVDIFYAIKNKKIRKITLQWNKGFAVCVVLTAPGYPEKYQKQILIHGLRDHKKVKIFHSGTAVHNGDIVSWGGRVLGITAVGRTLQNAMTQTYNSIGKKGVYFAGMQFRRDIGKKGLMLGK